MTSQTELMEIAHSLGPCTLTDKHNVVNLLERVEKLERLDRLAIVCHVEHAEAARKATLPVAAVRAAAIEAEPDARDSSAVVRDCRDEGSAGRGRAENEADSLWQCPFATTLTSGLPLVGALNSPSQNSGRSSLPPLSSTSSP